MEKYRLKQWYPNLHLAWSTTDNYEYDREDNRMYNRTRWGTISITAPYLHSDFWELIEEEEPLFVTEDGVNIYGNMKTYMVYSNLTMSNKNINNEGTNSTIKYFYHKENALAYIKKHKEKTLEDYEKMLFENDNSMTFSPKSAYFSVYGWIKDNEPKLYYTKILQLIADHLNDGWVVDFSGDHTNWFIKEGGSDWTIRQNYGTVFFKTMELSEKARSILGDKVKYLFS